ncbi:MAG: transketolase [Methylococcaceae bacterium]|nr:MAG: transketolase [Methylococcaceae bacterium]
MNHNNSLINKELRRQIVDMVVAGEDGHIPSAFSILDIITLLYREVLKFDAGNPQWQDRDYFILSKGHGCLALYANLHRHGFITDKDIAQFCKKGGILGEHPDRTKIPGVEASTGSLGHGLSFATGIALGLRIRGRNNRLFVLVGDGECHEGTVWEAANVARNQRLGNLCAFVDWNQSAMQLLPHDDMPAKWAAFGWNVQIIDGHSENEIRRAIAQVQFHGDGIPSVIVAKTVKGKGVPLIEGHGIWHHRIPDASEYATIMEALT